MSIEAILTLAAVLLAVIALIPPERSSDIRLRLGVLPRTVILSAAVCVLYWTFLDQVHALPFIRRLGRPIPWIWRWSPSTLSLFALLSAGAFAGQYMRRRLSPMRLHRLVQILADALSRRKYDEAIHLVETHIETLTSAIDGAYWQRRLRIRFMPTPAELHLKALNIRKSKLRSIDRDASEVRGKAESSNEYDYGLLKQGKLDFSTPPRVSPMLRRIVAMTDRPQEAAVDVVRMIALTPLFVRAIATSNPHLGVRLLRLPSTWILREFAESFATALFDDKESILFRELRRASSVDQNGVFLLDSRDQPLLTLIASDSIAVGGGELIWPFLTAGSNELSTVRRYNTTDVLNTPLSDYFERGRWTSPPFAALYLLKIVVPRLAVEPNAHVPNLYFLLTFTRAVLENMPIDADETTTGEWPTPYHYLLYECVSGLVDWISISRLNPHAFRIVEQSQSGNGERNTVPHIAIDVLGAVMNECLSSNRLTGRYCGYLLEVWWRAYADKYQKDEWPLSAKVLDSLINGGTSSTNDVRRKRAIGNAFNRIDVMYQVSVPGKLLLRRLGLGESNGQE